MTAKVDKETPEYALALAMLMWSDKVSAASLLSCIMRCESIPCELANKAINYIERHPVLDTLEQDEAIRKIEVMRSCYENN